MDKILFNPSIDWKPFTGCKSIGEESIHIFKCRISDSYVKIENCYKNELSKKELLKSERFLHIKDKQTYIVAKYTLRSLLSLFLNKPAKDIEFHTRGNKKPGISGMEFNISHSRDYVMIALSLNHIGIDIEFIDRDFNYKNLLNDCFDVAEQQFIDQNANDSLVNFYMLWTRKEAVLKASGEGLTADLRTLNCIPFSVSRNQANYKIFSHLINKDYVLSYASPRTPKELLYWNYELYHTDLK